MAFWEQIKEGIFRIRDDKGTHTVTKVLGGQTLLDQTKDVVRTIDKRKIIRIYEANTGKRLK